MNSVGRDWIEALPDELSGQRALLRRLLAACEANETIRWLVVACSVGRGAADRFSDLDMGMGVSDDSFDTALADVRRIIDDLGELVDSYSHQLPNRSLRHERIFAQYANRCQIDLVVIPASQSIGAVKDETMLYNRGEHEVAPFEPQILTAEQLREWAFAGWCALIDLGKYLRRGSPWEALQRLHEARDWAWRLWAAVLDVPNPQFGLTSILDFAPGRLPAGMGPTVSDLEPASLLAAARTVAAQLAEAGEQLPPALRGLLPAAMACYVSDDLAGITLPGEQD
jgi:hypothetical protein